MKTQKEKTLLEKIAKAEDLISQEVEKARKDGKNYTFAFSGGKDSAVLAHIASKVLGFDTPILAILSDTEFIETYEYVFDFARDHSFDLTVDFYNNDPSKPESASKENKTQKFRDVFERDNIEVWFSGIRKDEATTRLDIQDVEEVDGIRKINPIADFTEKDIWRYLAIYDVDVNPAYRSGYRSLSCKLSSVVEKDGSEPERAGRWKGTENEGKECGIHSCSLRNKKDGDEKKNDTKND